MRCAFANFATSRVSLTATCRASSVTLAANSAAAAFASANDRRVLRAIRLGRFDGLEETTSRRTEEFVLTAEPSDWCALPRTKRGLSEWALISSGQLQIFNLKRRFDSRKERQYFQWLSG
jgi:hypothetical protein